VIKTGLERLEGLESLVGLGSLAVEGKTHAILGFISSIFTF